MKTLFRLALLLLFVTAVAAADPPGGALVVVGGGKLPDAVRKEFVKLAAGMPAKIVVIPTASELADDPKEQASYLQPWKDAGVAAVVLLHTRDPKRADQEEFFKPLQDATGIWFSGGDQSKLTAAYLKTRTLTAIRDRYRAGAVVGGTSAGAAVMSDVMITGGTREATTAEGFGFLTQCVFDQHFTQRKREQRLAGVLLQKPTLLGVGIDESTAVIVQGGVAKVLGNGAAHFSESAGVHKSIPLRTGERYDWAKRSRLP